MANKLRMSEKSMNKGLQKMMEPGQVPNPGGAGQKKMGQKQKLIMASSAAAGSVWRAPRSSTGKKRGG